MNGRSKTFHLAIKEYLEDLTRVFTYTETVFKEIKDNELEQFDNSLKIKTSLGTIVRYRTDHRTCHCTYP